MRVAIIGGGASGLLASGICASMGATVFLIDKNSKFGKKIYITGKGRCNLSNHKPTSEFLENVVRNSKFLYSAINAFSPYDTLAFFEDNGLKTKIERGDRVFPASDKASDVSKCLEKYCQRMGVTFLLDDDVTKIDKTSSGFVIHGKENICVDRVILATGGKSYSATGSTGDGYAFAKSFGHSITELKPALVPIKLKDNVENLQGISLKNVQLEIFSNGKKIRDFFGEMLFTDCGISGPIALSASSYINRLTNVELFLNLKPALTEEMLKKRYERDFDKYKNIQVKNYLRTYMPENLCQFFLKKCEIKEYSVLKSIPEKAVEKMFAIMKSIPLQFDCLYPLDSAIITSGGVSTVEINPKTMESKLVDGLFFAGEIIDVDALTGGYNLQIAFSTGYVAGKNAGGN